MTALSDAVGSSTEWKDCLLAGAEAIPDSEFDQLADLGPAARSQSALKYNAEISGACAKKVDLATNPDATPEQAANLRALTAYQLSQAFSAGRLTDAQAGCLIDNVDAFSDEEVIAFSNASPKDVVVQMRGWMRECA